MYICRCCVVRLCVGFAVCTSRQRVCRAPALAADGPCFKAVHSVVRESTSLQVVVVVLVRKIATRARGRQACAMLRGRAHLQQIRWCLRNDAARPCVSRVRRADFCVGARSCTVGQMSAIGDGSARRVPCFRAQRVSSGRGRPLQALLSTRRLCGGSVAHLCFARCLRMRVVQVERQRPLVLLAVRV